MNSFIPWVGGKMALRDEIVERFPLAYRVYVEVFGGGGWVLFHKQPDTLEVYNDFNSNLVTLFRMVREQPDALIRELDWSLNSREDFGEIVTLFKQDAKMPDLRRAANMFKLIRYSYGSKCSNFGCQPCDMTFSYNHTYNASGKCTSCGASNGHTHVYKQSVAAAHPHEVTMKCNCGYIYTNGTTLSASCSSCAGCTGGHSLVVVSCAPNGNYSHNINQQCSKCGAVAKGNANCTLVDIVKTAKGNGTDRAAEYLRKAAESKNPNAQYTLAKLILDGKIEGDMDEALGWLTSCADCGNQFAQYALGKLFLSDEIRDVDKALRWLTASAEQQNQYAQFALGMMYFKGNGVERDIDEAKRWYEAAVA